MSDLLKKIPPNHYLHVLNNNSNVVRLETGPKTLLLKDEEVSVLGPSPMIVIPPRHYVIIDNPVCGNIVVDKEGKRLKVIEYDENHQSKLRHGASEVRLEQDPFPLYPGEMMRGKIEPLEIVPANEALKLEATHDFMDRYSFDESGKSIFRKAGDKWLFFGPQTYIPQCEVRVVHTVKGELIKPNHALKLEALSNFKDRDGHERIAGEQWLYSKEGSFIPHIYEKIVERIGGIILTDQKAIHVEALVNFDDPITKEPRKAGDTWRVTKDETEVFIPPVQVRVINNNVPVNTLTDREFVVIENPWDPEKKTIQYGKREVIRGEKGKGKSFFLHPNERIHERKGVIILTAEEAIEVQALQNFEEESENENGRVSLVRRRAGEKWLVCGPKEYWPPVQVSYNEYGHKRRAIINIEALNIRIWKLDRVILYVLAVLFGLFIIIRLFR